MPSEPPNIGDFVTVRGRHWLVEGQESSVSDLDVIKLACIDDDAQGEHAQVLWQAELDAKVHRGEDWDRLGEEGADHAQSFSAYLQTVRWNSATAADRRLFQAPFRAGIRMSAYQLAPLEKALALPRVNLLIADDVGLGKTVEAGLILRELLLRRRLDFFLVAAPASMTVQWQDELASKFGLAATIIDRDFLGYVRRLRGFGANPWATGSAFIISHSLLRDETYTAGLREILGSTRSRSLLILDEAHHAAPASGSKYAIDSQFTRALRDIAPRFEHRLFLTATPHNGHSNSFSALLEMLDPQRFTRGINLTPFELRKQLEPVMIRRLKSDLRELQLDRTFPERVIEPVVLDDLPPDTPELILADKLEAYRELREKRISHLPNKDAAAARLVFSGLQQRLLSSVAAFARTLKVHRQTLEKTRNNQASFPLEAAEAYASGAPEAGDLSDDQDETLLSRLEKEEEAATKAATRAGVVGSSADQLDAEIALVEEMLEIAQPAARRPDARSLWIADWVRAHMQTEAGAWNDRRLIIFTEWEDTRVWLEKRLHEALDGETDSGRIRSFTGATPLYAREEIKHAFNAPPADNPLRILICTDAAREGINLQKRCPDLIHFDLPWNPSRLEQRNGRIDRKLQPAKKVTCRYFVYQQRSVDVVLQALVRKTETIRSELGAVGNLIETRLIHRLSTGVARSEVSQLADDITNETGGDAISRIKQDMDDETARRRNRLREEVDRLRKLIERARRRVGVKSEALEEVTLTALRRAGVDLEASSFDTMENVKTWALDPDEPAFAHDPSWAVILDELRELPRKKNERLAEWRERSPVRRLAFEPVIFEDGSDADNVVQLHLEHRLVRRLLSRFQAHGFQTGLNRTCVLLSDDARPRVVLVGRLSLFGPSAARLHEEIFLVSALWREEDRGPLRPLVEKGDAAHITMETLNAALRAARQPAAAIVERCAGRAAMDALALKPELERRAEARTHKVSGELKDLADEEAKALRELLEAHRDRIAASVQDPPQLRLDLEPEERRQAERDRAHWEQKLTQIEREVEEEPEKIRAQYEVRAQRIEPIGVVYLWPKTG